MESRSFSICKIRRITFACLMISGSGWLTAVPSRRWQPPQQPRFRSAKPPFFPFRCTDFTCLIQRYSTS
jgi:hypothetical protein